MLDRLATQFANININAWDKNGVNTITPRFAEYLKYKASLISAYNDIYIALFDVPRYEASEFSLYENPYNDKTKSFYINGFDMLLFMILSYPFLKRVLPTTPLLLVKEKEWDFLKKASEKSLLTLLGDIVSEEIIDDIFKEVIRPDYRPISNELLYSYLYELFKKKTNNDKNAHVLLFTFLHLFLGQVFYRLYMGTALETIKQELPLIKHSLLEPVLKDIDNRVEYMQKLIGMLMYTASIHAKAAIEDIHNVEEVTKLLSFYRITDKHVKLLQNYITSDGIHAKTDMHIFAAASLIKLVTADYNQFVDVIQQGTVPNDANYKAILIALYTLFFDDPVNLVGLFLESKLELDFDQLAEIIEQYNDSITSLIADMGIKNRIRNKKKFIENKKKALFEKILSDTDFTALEHLKNINSPNWWTSLSMFLQGYVEIYEYQHAIKQERQATENTIIPSACKSKKEIDKTFIEQANYILDIIKQHVEEVSAFIEGYKSTDVYALKHRLEQYDDTAIDALKTYINDMINFHELEAEDIKNQLEILAENCTCENILQIFSPYGDIVDKPCVQQTLGNNPEEEQALCLYLRNFIKGVYDYYSHLIVFDNFWNKQETANLKSIIETILNIIETNFLDENDNITCELHCKPDQNEQDNQQEPNEDNEQHNNSQNDNNNNDNNEDNEDNDNEEDMEQDNEEQDTNSDSNTSNDGNESAQNDNVDNSNEHSDSESEPNDGVENGQDEAQNNNNNNSGVDDNMVDGQSNDSGTQERTTDENNMADTGNHNMQNTNAGANANQQPTDTAQLPTDIPTSFEEAFEKLQELGMEQSAIEQIEERVENIAEELQNLPPEEAKNKLKQLMQEIGLSLPENWDMPNSLLENYKPMTTDDLTATSFEFEIEEPEEESEDPTEIQKLLISAMQFRQQRLDQLDNTLALKTNDVDVSNLLGMVDLNNLTMNEAISPTEEITTDIDNYLVSFMATKQNVSEPPILIAPGIADKDLSIMPSGGERTDIDTYIETTSFSNAAYLYTTTGYSTPIYYNKEHQIELPNIISISVLLDLSGSVMHTLPDTLTMLSNTITYLSQFQIGAIVSIYYFADYLYSAFHMGIVMPDVDLIYNPFTTSWTMPSGATNLGKKDIESLLQFNEILIYQLNSMRKADKERFIREIVNHQLSKGHLTPKSLYMMNQNYSAVMPVDANRMQDNIKRSMFMFISDDGIEITGDYTNLDYKNYVTQMSSLYIPQYFNQIPTLALSIGDSIEIMQYLVTHASQKVILKTNYMSTKPITTQLAPEDVARWQKWVNE